MEAERNLYAGAVDQLAVGTIILDEEGKVLEINKVARELETEDDGLRVSNRALQIGTQQDTRKFRELIKETLAHPRNNTPSIVQAMRIARLSGKRDHHSFHSFLSMVRYWKAPVNCYICQRSGKTITTCPGNC
ncbi:hypothetical protein [Endozoicomonas sp.]|uniref:hypothetical protein n=1 Tax=Endozoicomonas sp. TaxID=1892382 RepID=UPI002884A123|nr:hypothetical protein [Endozoicomonas sp.]